ncbi:hypothetical protein AB0F17_04260 [Nonomuraea sp. NPDC026600]|uniref:hypothetical protein n=1 Tax=Nonomuraea sp. NPDC026600 TaxID=3155363 RepID=UPI0034071F37
MGRREDSDGVPPWLLAAGLSGRPGTPTGMLAGRPRRSSEGWVRALARAITRGRHQ